MSDVDDVLRRLGVEPDFRAAVELDPATALEGLQLTDGDLRRIDAVLRTPAASVEQFFADPVAPSGPRTGGSPWRGRAALVAGAVGSLALGLLLGARGWVAEPTPPAVDLAADAFPLHACPSDADAVPAPIGEVTRGDELWAIGRGPDGWVAVRNPADLTATAWVRSAHADVDVADLPERACDEVTVDLQVTDRGAPATEPSPTDPLATTDPTTDPATTPTTAPPTVDRVPPRLRLGAPDGTLLYTDNNLGCRPTRLAVSVELVDDRGPATLDELTYEFVGRSGTVRRGALRPVGDDRWELGPIGLDAPVDGPVPLRVSGTARDAAGNTTVETLDLTVRPYGMDCIG